MSKATVGTPVTIGVIPRNKALAAHSVRRLEKAADLTSGQMIGASSWLTASLFAINGAGILSALNSIEKLSHPLGTAAVFAVGVLFALLSAVAIQSVTEKTVEKLEPLVTFWQMVEVDGVLDHGEFQELKTDLDKLTRYHIVPPALGWISGIIFLVGVAVFALGLPADHAKTRDVCSRLENDMLKIKPARSDSRQLFEALQCAR